jgi:SAM-dependent methyltransferase
MEFTQEEKKIIQDNVKIKGNEVEIRFGTFDRSFTPQVTKEQFDRVFIFLSNNKNFYTHIVKKQKIEIEKNIRKITEQKKSTYNEKKKITNLDNKEWGYRLSVSSEKEIEVQSFSVEFLKTRERHSFTNTKNKTRFDLDISENLFTIELECLDGCPLSNLQNELELVMHLLQNNRILINKTTSFEVLKHYHSITKKSKFFGVQPMTLSDEKFNKKEKYALTKKLDGLRYNLVCFNKQLYSVSSKLIISPVPYSCDLKCEILDVEYYKNYYHVFDLIDADPKSKSNLMCRIQKVSKILQNIKPMFKDVPPIVIKEYYFTDKLEDLYSKFKDTTSNLDSKIYDGLILVKSQENYLNSSPLKWKPVEMNTIDFLLKKKPNLKFDLYVGSKEGLFLFTSTIVTKKDYDTYKDDDIVEFSYKNENWVPLKSRADKLNPNFITVAEDNFHSVINPFNPETTFKKNVLFNMRRFHNYVKRKYISKYISNSVLDLASGQGGDFGKYLDNNVSLINGYDINAKSIKEATSRIMKIDKKHKDVKINIFQQDLNKEVVKPGNTKFGLVVTNFAFHYFYKNLDNYLKSVKNNIAKGGHLLLTFFDGSLVKDIKTEFYDLKIVKDELCVHIKDSILNKPEKEPIVDVNLVVNYFEKNGLKLVENLNFKDIYPEWEKCKNSMSKDEKTLSFMNVVLVFKSI